MNQLVKGRKAQKSHVDPHVGEIYISYFTDPLCAWSWAFEKEWQLLKTSLGSRLHVTYHMGGLIPDWKTFNDSVNSVTRPVQMGPVWMHIAEITNIKLNTSIWMRNPPASSYPACIAFKCVELQSRTLAETYLLLLREAVMLSGENISKTDVLLRLADYPLMNTEAFDPVKFKEDLFNGAGLEAFRKDLQMVQMHGINRFPTLIVRKNGSHPVLVSGYKTHNDWMEVITKES